MPNGWLSRALLGLASTFDVTDCVGVDMVRMLVLSFKSVPFTPSLLPLPLPLPSFPGGRPPHASSPTGTQRKKVVPSTRRVPRVHWTGVWEMKSPPSVIQTSTFEVYHRIGDPYSIMLSHNEFNYI